MLQIFRFNTLVNFDDYKEKSSEKKKSFAEKSFEVMQSPDKRKAFPLIARTWAALLFGKLGC